ncbi:uncharacterized protein LOC133304064 [Gastrolobium bilobum]|uniref:uncharacterized protein LOC133304064 n=1 Tax=Gastrolobium bilobum TaxID=150636 RepID=UPI002AB1F47C|nr:uncharacterized protein LOC133304064 [Gastrolobium bilobum]
MVPEEDDSTEERMSFKEMLMRHNGEWEMHEAEEEFQSEKEDENFVDAEAESKEDSKNPEVVRVKDGDGKTNFQLSAGFKKRAWMPWRKALYEKLLGKKLALPIMKKRLENMWAREGKNFVTDVENGFFFLRFSDKKDMDFAVTAGPWVLFDHYLAIRLWEPDFQSHFAAIDRILAWVCRPSFPVEYVNTELINEVGNWLGKFVKMDAATTCLVRGNFARICVELNLGEPLHAEYKIEGKLKQVEYERLHFVCFNCGKYGHRSENCPSKAMQVLAETSGTNMLENNMGEDKQENRDLENTENKQEGNYGPWMLVNKQRRQNKNVINQGGKEGSSAVNDGNLKSSRFSVLYNVEENEERKVVDEKENSLSFHRDLGMTTEVGKKKGVRPSNQVVETANGYIVVDGETGKKIECLERVGKNGGQSAVAGNPNHDAAEDNKMAVDNQGNQEGGTVGQNQGKGDVTHEELSSIQSTSLNWVRRRSVNQGQKSLDQSKKHVSRPPDTLAQSTKKLDENKRSSSLVRTHLVNKSEAQGKQEAQGFSGGIWAIWSSNKFLVDIIKQSTQFMHMNIKIQGHSHFVCTAVYASPRKVERQQLWNDLKDIGNSSSEAWIMGGDFNKIARMYEKKGGNPPDSSKCELFSSVLDDCNVVDLGCSGSPFTWQGPKWGHLDRIF